MTSHVIPLLEVSVDLSLQLRRYGIRGRGVCALRGYIRSRDTRAAAIIPYFFYLRYRPYHYTYTTCVLLILIVYYSNLNGHW